MVDVYALNTFRKRYKGCGLLHKMKYLRGELRWAVQRFWRGYDEMDVFDLGPQILSKLPILLREFKKLNIGRLNREDGSPMTMEETDEIIDQLLFYFENLDEEHVYRRLYHAEMYKEEYDREKNAAVNAEIVRCLDEGMKLLSQYIWQLWY